MMKRIKNIIFSSDKEKLTEKAFKQSIAISVLGIVLCMVVLCSATWAWFSTGVSSPANNIKSAYCDIIVSVINENAALDAQEGKYTLAKDKAYEVKINATGTAETAYCILKIGGNEYYTVQIPTQTAVNHISFTLQFTAEAIEIEIITRWGTSSKPEAERTFENGGLYLDCGKVDLLPIIVPETTPTTETTALETNNTEPTVFETTPTETTAEAELASPSPR